MNLFEIILHEYPLASCGSFAGHRLASSIRKEFPKEIHGLIDHDERYLVRGSAGRSAWAHCPWLAVMDRRVTESPRRGFYPVYLFKKDLSGFYLSLNLAVANIMARYRKKSRSVLKSQANIFRDAIGEIPPEFPLTSIELLGETDTAKNYEAGTVIAKYYGAGDVPDMQIMQEDLLLILEIYDYLITNENQVVE
ncbi:DUF3578 domain-containing protein [Lewinella sp. W8]|uniref:MrcB family domain-containing protein n=1 Tax=Lewinella sp. W8 TaxID=2528208 RepID=UPI001067E4DB|nr:DUF3578 domain-containing protein [Lewinella sp. W8]MTB51511.1 DUF3578 domain-containing protein [Lewinella sp. W8]